MQLEVIGSMIVFGEVFLVPGLLGNTPESTKSGFPGQSPVLGSQDRSWSWDLSWPVLAGTAFGTGPRAGPRLASCCDRWGRIHRKPLLSPVSSATSASRPQTGPARINGQVGQMAARPLIAARAGFCPWDQPGLGPRRRSCSSRLQLRTGPRSGPRTSPDTRPGNGPGVSLQFRQGSAAAGGSLVNKLVPTFVQDVYFSRGTLPQKGGENTPSWGT